MENHKGYQRQLILARFTRLDECMAAEGEAEAESDDFVLSGGVSDELRRLVVEFERLLTVALSRGFTREDFVDLYGLNDYDQDSITRDRMNDASVEVAIRAREGSLFDALVALVPGELTMSR